MSLIGNIKNREALRILGRPINFKEKVKSAIGLGYKTIGDFLDRELKETNFDVYIKGSIIHLSNRYGSMDYDVIKDEISSVSLNKELVTSNNVFVLLYNSRGIRDFYHNLLKIKAMNEFNYEEVLEGIVNDEIREVKDKLPFLEFSYNIHGISYDYYRGKITADVLIVGKGFLSIDINAEYLLFEQNLYKNPIGHVRKKTTYSFGSKDGIVDFSVESVKDNKILPERILKKYIAEMGMKLYMKTVSKSV